MNWETAKTWLIGIFLFLDIALGWQWLQSRNEMLGYVESTSDLLANTKTLLAEHGLALATDVPTDIPALASLHADYPKATLTDIAKTAFPSAGDIKLDTVTATAVARQGTVRMLEPGTWTVSFTPPIAVQNGDFTAVLGRTWRSNNFAPDAISNIDGQVVYLERYNNYPLFDVPLSYETQGKTVLGFTENLVMNITPVGADKPVISALDALDSLAVSVDKNNSSGDNRISKIDLGYLRKLQANPFGLPAAPTTYWFPVWRVVTTNQVYYINAFSGEVDS